MTWKNAFLVLQALLAVGAFLLVALTTRDALEAANAIPEMAKRAKQIHAILDTLISWKVVSGLGVLVTIPKLPTIISAIKTKKNG